MTVTLTNFKPVGFTPIEDVLHVGEDGALAARAAPGATVVDCNGAYVSPGWCDLHVHVWYGGTDISVRAARAGRQTGVTAMADAGSAGEATFHGLREYVIDTHRETIKAFINIGSIGLTACNRVSELSDARSIDVDRTLEAIDRHRGVICGIKVRASGVIVGSWGAGPLRVAKHVAQIAGLPLMVHIGESPPVIDEVLDILTPGDIVTHCFNGKRGGSVIDTPRIFERVKQVARDGVLMDVGHGFASFNFSTARAAIEGGLIPHSISTDIHARNVDGPVFDLATTASKLLAVGLPLEDCIKAITTNPREVIGLQGPSLGSKADFTVFDLVEGDLDVVDSQGNRLSLSRTFEPRMTLIGTDLQPAARSVAH